MAENRRRDKTLTIRVTESERAAITAKAKRAKLSLTEYIVTLSRQVEIHPPADLSPLLVELKRIGNNLNQLAMKVNSGMAYVPDLREIIEQQNNIYRQLLTMTEDRAWQQ